MSERERVISLQGSEPAKPAATYSAHVRCHNCGYAGSADIPKGKTVDQGLCPQCECRTIDKLILQAPPATVTAVPVAVPLTDTDLARQIVSADALAAIAMTIEQQRMAREIQEAHDHESSWRHGYGSNQRHRLQGLTPGALRNGSYMEFANPALGEPLINPIVPAIIVGPVAEVTDEVTPPGEVQVLGRPVAPPPTINGQQVESGLLFRGRYNRNMDINSDAIGTNSGK